MVISFLLNAVSLTHEVSLEVLTIAPADLSVTCNGGDTGLTNTSVLVEYRVVNTTSSTSSVGEWRYLYGVVVGNGIVNLPRAQLDDDSGFQLRLLQLEHGGGECNCWTLSSFSVDCGESITSTNITLCSEQARFFTTSSVFCGGYASRARGMITEVYCSVSNNSEACPGDSDTLLPSGGPALPSHCEISDFRM